MIGLILTLACMKGVISPPPEARRAQDLQVVPSRIAFGSCARQNKPQPILDVIVAQQPELMVYLGDNVYLDTQQVWLIRSKYRRLLNKPAFRRLREAMPTVATWDDHDYGDNDANREYPKKDVSKAAFMEFWGIPDDSPMRNRDGIYDAHEFSDGNRTVQLIMLDTRWFLDPMDPNPPEYQRAYDYPFKHDYQPDEDDQTTILGETQWTWLETQLRRPADLRIIASSIQFGHTYNGYESWNNRPHEKDRMQQLIRDTGAAGVLFLSGDVHWGELSRMAPDIVSYPLYDMTSSGLNQIWDSTEYNANRLGSVVDEEHFGLLDIDWAESDPSLRLQLLTLSGDRAVDVTLKLSELTPQSPKN